MGVAMLTCLCGREFNGDILSGCPACQMPVAQVKRVTPEERAARKRQLADAAVEKRRLESMADEEKAAELARARENFISRAIDRMCTALESGLSPALHSVLYMASEYSVGGQVAGSTPSVESWAEYGWDGWEIVATVPHTTGMHLLNRVGGAEVYGAGIGGLVSGVFLVMRLPVTASMINDRRHELVRILERQYEEANRESHSYSFETRTMAVHTGGQTDVGATAPFNAFRGAVAGAMIADEVFGGSEF